MNAMHSNKIIPLYLKVAWGVSSQLLFILDSLDRWQIVIGQCLSRDIFIIFILSQPVTFDGYIDHLLKLYDRSHKNEFVGLKYEESFTIGRLSKRTVGARIKL